jgi:hypothetical protein
MRPFAYIRSVSVENAISAMQGARDAKFLGGGTNIVDLMKMGVEQPAQLIEAKEYSGYSFGAQFAEVRIDADLGQNYWGRGSHSQRGIPRYRQTSSRSSDHTG